MFLSDRYPNLFGQEIIGVLVYVSLVIQPEIIFFLVNNREAPIIPRNLRFFKAFDCAEEVVLVNIVFVDPT